MRKDVWKKVQPIIEQLNQKMEDAPGATEPAPKKMSARPAGARYAHSAYMLADVASYTHLAGASRW